MSGIKLDSREMIARLVRNRLERGATVDIDGLGSFIPGDRKTFRFIAQTRPRVFIAYVAEDLFHARRLFDDFTAAGYDPWLDKMKLLPGQNWPRAIEQAIQSADFFVACFSKRAVSKRGSFQCELRFALECASRVPLDEIFLIPVRVEPCAVPLRITRHIHYVDLFPHRCAGVGRILSTIQEQREKREQNRLLLMS